MRLSPLAALRRDREQDMQHGNIHGQEHAAWQHGHGHAAGNCTLHMQQGHGHSAWI